MSCIICQRSIKPKQDSVTVTDFPLVCQGRATAHLLCFQMRICQSDNIATTVDAAMGFSKQGMTENSGVDIKCGYCRGEIGQADHIKYELCPHSHVHIRCASMMDFIRKKGCALCCSVEDENKCISLWMDENSVTTRAREIVIRNETDACVHSLPVQKNKALAAPEFVNANIESGMDASCIAAAYKKALFQMPQPRHSTPLRQYIYEKSMHAVNGTIRAKEIDEKVLDGLFSTYSLKELCIMGLTPQMFIDFLDIKPLLLTHLFGEYRRLAAEPELKITFVQLMMSGLSPNTIRPGGLAMLFMLDFKTAAYMASGRPQTDLFSNMDMSDDLKHKKYIFE